MPARTPRHAPKLGPLLVLMVVCTGCPSANAPPPPSWSGLGPQRRPPPPLRRTPTPRVAPRRNTPDIPALISGKNRPRPPVTRRQPTGAFGLPGLQSSQRRRIPARTNPAPRVIPRLPRTPAAAVRARVPVPKGTKPQGPGTVFGIGAGAAAVAGSSRDLARAFYTKYVHGTHRAMEADTPRTRARAHREALAKALRKGKAEEAQAYQAFRNLFDGAWNGLFGQASGVDFLLVDKPAGMGVTDGDVVAYTAAVLDQLFGGTTASTARADLRSDTGRLVDPMSAQDFYNQYLRAAHRSYAEAWSFANMDETNDFAEALATGRRANPVGYEAMRLHLKEAAAGKDVLGEFRTAWNHYLRLATGHGSDAPIQTSGGERRVKGKTEGEWKDLAEAAMGQVSEALEKAS